MPALQTKPTDREIDRAIGVLARQRRRRHPRRSPTEGVERQHRDGTGDRRNRGRRGGLVCRGASGLHRSAVGLVGPQRSRCRSRCGRDPSAATETELTARSAREAAAALTPRGPRPTSLARTAPVALANLHDEAGLVESCPTDRHADPRRPRGRRCLRAVVPGHPERGPDRAARRANRPGPHRLRAGCPLGRRIAEAERSRPSDFAEVNAEPAGALQGAWSAIAATRCPPTIRPTGVRRRPSATGAGGGGAWRRGRHRGGHDRRGLLGRPTESPRCPGAGERNCGDGRAWTSGPGESGLQDPPRRGTRPRQFLRIVVRPPAAPAASAGRRGATRS